MFQTPEVSDEEARELLLLRSRFGLSAEDVYARLPAWEVDLLLAVADDEETETPKGDPFSAVPSDLEALPIEG